MTFDDASACLVKQVQDNHRVSRSRMSGSKSSCMDGVWSQTDNEGKQLAWVIADAVIQ